MPRRISLMLSAAGVEIYFEQQVLATGYVTTAVSSQHGALANELSNTPDEARTDLKNMIIEVVHQVVSEMPDMAPLPPMPNRLIKWDKVAAL